MPKRSTKKTEPLPTPPASPAAIEKAEDEASHAIASSRRELPPISWAATACPTCGTAKTGNRCDVCGHQEHDT